MTQEIDKNKRTIEQLIKVHGIENVLVDKESCILYAQDIHSKTIPAFAIIRPKNKDELTESVKIANKLGHAIIPRGGGMSYSKGYVPLKEGSIIVDFSRMNNVIEINEEDMYVRVESGCTWETLYRELESTNLRTPFWGTLSGISATVGGIPPTVADIPESVPQKGVLKFVLSNSRYRVSHVHPLSTLTYMSSSLISITLFIREKSTIMLPSFRGT